MGVIRNRRSATASSTPAPTTRSRTACPTGSNPGEGGGLFDPHADLPLRRRATRCCARSCGRARQRQLEFSATCCARRSGEPYLSTLRRTWQAMTGPEGRPYLQMFGKLRENAEQQLWPNFRREATTDWLQPLEDGMRIIGRPELATLVLAVIRGLHHGHRGHRRHATGQPRLRRLPGRARPHDDRGHGRHSERLSRSPSAW